MTAHTTHGATKDFIGDVNLPCQAVDHDSAAAENTIVIECPREGQRGLVTTATRLPIRIFNDAIDASGDILSRVRYGES